MNRRLSHILLVPLMALFCSCAHQETEWDAPTQAAKPVPDTISLLSLNLHGYHPMGEQPRWVEFRDGKIQPANTDLFFFTEEELFRGERRRQEKLAADLRVLQPDIAIFQEVAAGLPQQDKSCLNFYFRRGEFEVDGENTVWRLERRLQDLGYWGAVACRGNIGWITENYTFAGRRIWRGESEENRELVNDFYEGFYPNGIIVEGFGMLVRAPWRIVDHEMMTVTFNDGGETISFEVATIGWYDGYWPETPNSWDDGALNKTVLAAGYQHRWLAVANLHAGHKLAHFEQAVAIRRAMDDYVKNRPFPENFGGLIIAGDFNARLYRPTDTRATEYNEIASIPWEIASDDEYNFRVDDAPDSSAELIEKLTELNNDGYKEWATVNGPNATSRIETAVKKFYDWQREQLEETGTLPVMQEAFSDAQDRDLCQPPSVAGAHCAPVERIDHIFTSPELKTQNAFILWGTKMWQSTETVSDHPGVMAEFSW